MSSNSTAIRERPTDDRPSSLSAPAFLGSETLRVRDLTGEIAVGASASSPVSPIVVTPARRGGRLTLSWYDYGVLALIAASVVAGGICLLHGV